MRLLFIICDLIGLCMFVYVFVIGKKCFGRWSPSSFSPSSRELESSAPRRFTRPVLKQLVLKGFGPVVWTFWYAHQDFKLEWFIPDSSYVLLGGISITAWKGGVEGLPAGRLTNCFFVTETNFRNTFFQINSNNFATGESQRDPKRCWKRIDIDHLTVNLPNPQSDWNKKTCSYSVSFIYMISDGDRWSGLKGEGTSGPIWSPLVHLVTFPKKCYAYNLYI